MGDPGRHYERLVRQVQAQARVPAVAVAVHRADRPLWTFTVGDAKPGAQFRIGSVTKTFTATLVMQCRDDGLLDLDDPIGRHLALPAHGELTIRRLLSHTAGLQREPYGDVWHTMDIPDASRLLAELDRAELVLPPARRYHYSNLGLSLLGQLVGRLRGGTWGEVLRKRILDPLGLPDTCVTPDGRAATGYLVDAYSDHARAEVPADFGAVSPAAQLWSTAADMARWGAFLADPAALDPSGAVLAPGTVDEMRWPLTVTDDAVWNAGFGLGLMLVPMGERAVHVGHDGAMPGFLAGVYGRHGGTGTPPACGVAVLGSSGTAGALLELPHRLLAEVVEQDPAEVPPWRMAGPVPSEYRSILGRWWGEGFEYVFCWRDGSLQAHKADDLPGRPPAVFARMGPDQFRTESGREAGELLRLRRDEAGAVVAMTWATYRFTRSQQTADGGAF